MVFQTFWTLWFAVAKYVESNQPKREEHWAYRQRWPHSHCMVTEPYTDKCVLLCRLANSATEARSAMVTVPQYRSGQLIPFNTPSVDLSWELVVALPSRVATRRRYHFVCDLGQDKVFVYTVDADAHTVREIAEVALEATQVCNDVSSWEPIAAAC